MTRLSHQFMADELQAMVFSKATWLSDFGHGRNARPAHEIETKQRELSVLKQAAADYRKASAKEQAA